MLHQNREVVMASLFLFKGLAKPFSKFLKNENKQTNACAFADFAYSGNLYFNKKIKLKSRYSSRKYYDC